MKRYYIIYYFSTTKYVTLKKIRNKKYVFQVNINQRLKKEVCKKNIKKIMSF